MSQSTSPAHKTEVIVIAITSGKGGVGKTSVSTNLGIALASRGQRVCIFDADTGMANINVLLGKSPELTLEHLLSGEHTIDEILIEGPHGVQIVPAASGIADCAQLNHSQHQRLIEALRELESRFDYLLIDTAAGASDTVLEFLRAAQQMVVVITPDPTSMTNAFSLLKIAKNRHIDTPAYILTNQVPNHQKSLEIFQRFQDATKKYLKVDTYYLGHILQDETLVRAIRLQRPLILLDHEAPASRCFYALSEAVTNHLGSAEESGGFSSYWAKRTESAKAPSQISANTTQPATPVELLEQLTAMIEKSAFGEQQIRPALATLLERYNNRFGSIPFNEQRALLRWLERNDFPAQETLTLSLTLEELFEKQHRQPLHDNERLLAKLVAQNRDSASAVESLLHGLINAYQSHNNRPLDNLQAPLQNSLLNGSLSEADARDAIASLTESFRDRFGRSPFEREESASVSHIDSARLASHDESN